MTETYNFINYLRIIDLSILNLFDYIDLNDSKSVYEINDKVVLNFNANYKKILEGFIINNINDATYYGKNNILVNTCNPSFNWRSYNSEQIKKAKIYLADDSIYIDEIKLNQFIDSVFSRLPNLNATLNKKGRYNDSISKINVSIQKKLDFIEFKEIDQYDLYFILNDMLSKIGNVSKDSFKYNIIEDTNLGFSHHEDISEELFDKVRFGLMNKGII